MQFLTSVLVVLAYFAIGYLIGLLCTEGHHENITVGGVIIWPIILGGYIIYILAAVFVLIFKWLRNLWEK